MKKILVIASVAALAVVLALFALGGEQRTETAPQESGRAMLGGERPAAPLAEPLPLASAAPLAAVAGDDESNATRALAEKIAKELLAKNPGGPSLADGASGLNVGDPDALIDELLARELAAIDIAAFSPAVSVSDLAVVADTPESARSFIEQFQEIAALFARAPLTTAEPMPQTFAPLARLADDTARKLETLPVPARFAPLLAQTVRLTRAHASIFSAIARADADPLRAFVALQAWQPTREELEKLYDETIRKL